MSGFHADNPAVADDDTSIWRGRRAKWANPEAKLWLDRMAEKGFTAPTWPKEYGGAGLSNAEGRVLQQELAGRACSALMSFGIWMLGPVLLEYANEEQKKEHFPGSFAARSAGARAIPSRAPARPRRPSHPGGRPGRPLSRQRPEDLDLYADKADWIFCLVRTDNAKKHEGISFMLFDMTTPASKRGRSS